MPNAQVGRQLVVQSPPQFANATVRGGSWEENDAAQAEMNENADEDVFNVTVRTPGEDVKCDLYPDAGFNPAVGDVMPEINVDTPRSWVITKVDRKRFGKRGLIYSLNMIRRDSLDTSITTS